MNNPTIRDIVRAEVAQELRRVLGPMHQENCPVTAWVERLRPGTTGTAAGWLALYAKGTLGEPRALTRARGQAWNPKSFGVRLSALVLVGLLTRRMHREGHWVYTRAGGAATQEHQGAEARGG